MACWPKEWRQCVGACHYNSARLQSDTNVPFEEQETDRTMLFQFADSSARGYSSPSVPFHSGITAERVI